MGLLDWLKRKARPSPITTGKKYPVAFLLFECAECPGNYLNYARSAVVAHFSRFDPLILRPDRKILSGDLLPAAAQAIGKMSADPKFNIDLQRLDARIASSLRDGEWPGEIYVIGIIFIVREGIDLLHQSMKRSAVAGYRGLLTIPITAGSSDIYDLGEVLRLVEAPINQRL